ncbi:MAG: hypothetical protein NTX15_02725 [Candidatus Kapabacteria bacterium]|nr:hypothetical protein [Candidatus Kapabacteria bacterium]
MKVVATIFAICLVMTTSAFAQKIELNALTNYMFGASTDYYNSNGSYYGEVYIAPSAVYGGAIDVDMRNNVMLELQYMYQPTTGQIRNAGLNTAQTDLANHFIQIGGLFNRDVNDKVTVFGGLMFGAEVFSPSSQKYETVTRFLGSLTGGAKIWINDKIGIRLNANLNMPMIFGGVGFYVGTGGGGYGATALVQLLQFSLGGGLVFKL